MSYKIVEVPAENPVKTLSKDEVLIVMHTYNSKRQAWVEQLVKKSYKNLTRHCHYANFYIGFQGSDGESPYVILEWTSEGGNALERRYVLAQLTKIVHQLFTSKQWVVYLENFETTEPVSYVEDIFFRMTTPLYESSRLDSLKLLVNDENKFKALDRYQSVRFQRQWQYRQWVNANPDEMTSIEIGRQLSAFASANGCEFETLDEEQLRNKGLNLLLAVGGASRLSPPRLHLLSKNLTKGQQPLLLVGKGITFDTGGINVKPHESYVNCMKNDMGGAALMSQLFMALVEAGYNGPLALAIPTCENLVAEKAMKPGAIIKSYSGKKVMVEHTDAEGRLILADAIAYAQHLWQPKLTIVAATLTTAALRQFSNFFTPVHFAKRDFQAALQKHGDQRGECFRFWDQFLPFLQGNMTNAADLTNMGRMSGKASIGGGSNVAAHFLQTFSSGPMIHIDIFATTWNWGDDYPGAHYGATGAPFNSLFDTLRSFCDEVHSH